MVAPTISHRAKENGQPMAPTFNNRPNECISAIDGREFFISRSPAVIPQVYCLVGDDELFILVNRRGPACPDHVDKWALPCGYLDWDESAEQASRREIFEECDFDISLVEKSNILWPQTMWQLVTDPTKDARQNILIHQTLGFMANALPEVTKIPDKETTEVLWMPVAQALNTDFAFGHQYNICDCLKFLADVSNKPFLPCELEGFLGELREQAPASVKSKKS